MNEPQSDEDKRNEFTAFVRSQVSHSLEQRAAERSSGSIGGMLDIRIALAALAVLFLVFGVASRADRRNYDSIIAGKRYSLGESDRFRWRYDGLDNGMYARDRHLTTFDRMRLRNTGVHVTYDDYASHRALRAVRKASGCLLVLGILLAAAAGWRRFQDAGIDEPSRGQSEIAPPAAPSPAPPGRPVFGRRAD